MKKILLLLTAAVLFTSCIFIPESDFDAKCDKLLAKTQLKNFDTVEDPIVIRKGIYSKFTSALSPSTTASNGLGNVYLVYDWKNDSVVDWCFISKKYETPRNNGDLLVSKRGQSGSRTFIEKSSWQDDVHVLKTYPENSISKLSVKGNFELCGNHVYDTKYALLYRSQYDLDDGFHIYNSETDVMQDFIPLELTDDSYFTSCEDPDGNFWISTNDSNKAYIVQIDSAANKFCTPLKVYDIHAGYDKKENDDWVNYDDYKLLFADEENLFIVRRSAYSRNKKDDVLIILNKSTGTETIVNFPDNESVRVNSINKINGQYYFVMTSSSTYKYGIYTFDIGSKQFTLKQDGISFVNLTEVLFNADKLFIITNTRGETKIKIYDPSSNTLSDEIIIDVNKVVSE